MADILLDRLPHMWAGRPIDWDFRPMVWFNGQYLRLPEDEKGLSELARETMRRFYRVAVPPEEEVDAFKALVEFYTAGPQEVADRPGSSRTEELALDYVTDGPAIVAAFQQAYGIDLTRARPTCPRRPSWRRSSGSGRLTLRSFRAQSGSGVPS